MVQWSYNTILIARQYDGDDTGQNNAQEYPLRVSILQLSVSILAAQSQYTSSVPTV